MAASPLSPGAAEFFSPKTTAELDQSLGDIEELLLDAGNASEHDCSGPDGHDSKTASIGKSALASKPKPKSSTGHTGQDYLSWNAVHMHVHENTKLATFNLPVDRTNSTLGLQIPAPRGRRTMGAKRPRQTMPKEDANLNCPASPLPRLQNTSSSYNAESAHQMDSATSDAIDEIIRLSENDMNLSELFLDHNDRSSAALAYSSSFGRAIPQISLEEKVSSAVTNEKSTQKDGPMLPYKRKQPLPIPSPPREKEMAAAFATAAAIASTSSPHDIHKSTAAALSASATTTTGKAPTVSASTNNPKQQTTLVTKVTSKTKPINVPSKKAAIGPPQPKPVYPANYSYHAVHAKTKASIAYATAQRSKFGFGGNHKVPSTAPPPVRVAGAPRIPPHLVGKAPYVLPRPGGPPGGFPPMPKSMPKDVGSTIAYERKKQRAKDARIRLNEAIEELAVAIDLAGAQSNERFNYLKSQTALPIVGGSPVVADHLATLMENTIKEASTAKKWDRPSFVALSATMLTSLNAQCEGLMKEVARLRGTANNEEMNPDAVPSCVQLSSSSDGSNDAANLRSDFGTCSKANPIEPEAKKVKLDSSTYCSAEERQRLFEAAHNVIDTPTLLQRIASFLDPSSSCKCCCVSKRWANQNIFHNHDLWLNFCIKRFGVTAVRKWQDYDDDEDDEQASESVCPTMNLYCRMAERNVKPPCSLEGSAFMGGSSLDGIVSGWVSLMERSNGETSRSVMLKQGDDSKRCYGPIPVIELRILLQNTGSNGVVSFPDQQFAVDVSTRRKGEKMLEVCSDERFKKRVLHIEKRGGEVVSQSKSLGKDMCSLGLFEYAILSVHIHARGCSTSTKFCNRAKKLQLLVSINGTTRPLVIPLYSLNGHL